MTARVISGCAVLALVLPLLSCAPDTPAPRSATAAPVTAIPASPPSIPSYTPPPLGTPLLAAPPLTCPTDKVVGQPEDIMPTLGDVSSPIASHPTVWIQSGVELPGPQLFVNSAAGTPGVHGFGGKWIWEVRDTLVGQVEITSGGLTANTPIWWDLQNGSAPVTTLVLDPRHPNHFESTEGYAEWGLAEAIPGGAGCRWIRATWPGGTWTIVFAYGSLF
jgi:hypothetical protein